MTRGTAMAAAYSPPEYLPISSAVGKPLASLVSSAFVAFVEDRRPTPYISTTSYVMTAVILLLSIVAFLYMVMNDYRRHAVMPPGPSPVPFVGNKWDLPSCKPWYKFKQWTDMYGSLVTVWTGRRPTVIIGDPQVACDLLDRRSSIYSSRPRFVVMGELFTNNDSLLTMPHGDKWRKTRKIFHNGLMRKACETYKPIQEAESQRLALDLLRKPQEFGRHLERFASSVMVCVAYGRRVDDLDDSIVRQIHERMQYMSTLNVPGAFWAESFPLLKRVPDFLAPWKREVKQRAEASSELLLDLAQQVRHRMHTGTVAPSFTKTLWERYDQNPEELTKREIAYATGSIFGAGSDTSSATLMSFMLAMTCFPGVMVKAQEELDRVVGRDRAPTWSDEANLPYCKAVIKETLRWRPVAVMGGTPHASTEDDYYNGHFIPAGTTILGNLWAIHHNQKYFNESQEFMPERYLGLQHGVEPYPHRDGHSAFGWGRRICPGKLLAENSLFISITRILWGFNVEKYVNPATGAVDEYNTFAYTDGFNSRPHPFRCHITPRSEQLRETMEREACLGEKFLERYI